MNDLTTLFIYGFICYLLGSISFGTIISRIAKGIDITKQGSGSTGATNVLRSVGFTYGFLVLFLDITKSTLPLLIINNMQYSTITFIPHLCGLLAIVGHCFPIFHKFKGGKGVATGVGPLFVLFIPSGIVAITSFFLIVALTRLVSLGSIIACIMSVVSLLIFLLVGILGANFIDLIYIVPAVTLIMLKHKENIKRLIDGTENKISFNQKNEH
jgi:glycerol-3-phosphate acyltransferase PlsY